jgi:predicted TIM-barrel fold metal-dependent hydrolase
MSTDAPGGNSRCGYRLDWMISVEDITPHALRYADMRPGCYEPKARLRDMDEAGVLASLNFPSFPRFAGQTVMEGDDPVLGELCIKAWNDWLVEEWCAAGRGRFIPGTLIPFWDVQASVREVQRCAEMGSKGVIFSENPAKLSHKGQRLPPIHWFDHHWDPLWAVLQETGLPLLMHYGSSSNMSKTAEDAPYLVSWPRTASSCRSRRRWTGSSAASWAGTQA